MQLKNTKKKNQEHCWRYCTLVFRNCSILTFHSKCANALRSATHKLHLCPVQRHGHLPDDQRVCGLWACDQILGSAADHSVVYGPGARTNARELHGEGGFFACMCTAAHQACLHWRCGLWSNKFQYTYTELYNFLYIMNVHNKAFLTKIKCSRDLQVGTLTEIIDRWDTELIARLLCDFADGIFSARHSRTSDFNPGLGSNLPALQDVAVYGHRPFTVRRRPAQCDRWICFVSHRWLNWGIWRVFPRCWGQSLNYG